MRFMRKVSPTNGSNCVYLDLQGLKLEDKDTTTAPMEGMSENDVVEQFCYFRISTFDILKLKAVGTDAFDDVFRPVHTFFNECNDDELKELATMYLNMHYDILDKLRGREEIQLNITTLTKRLAEYLAQVDTKLNIVPRLRAIVDRDIPIPQFTNVGERPQDSDEMTFRREEVVELATVVVLCKMMTPIFGVYIERCKKKMDTSLKEVHCVGILLKILEHRFYPIILKLKNFITKLIAPYMKDDLTYIFNGHTLPLVSHQIFAAILTRRFVNVNLYQHNCNLMTYITACARSATTSAGSTASNHRSSVEEIKRPKELHGDDGNTSILEVESRRSNKTADQLGIIELAVNTTIDWWLAENDISLEQFMEIEAFYLMHPAAVTPINTYLICVVFGNHMGGATSVEMMTMQSLTKMITLVQLYLVKNNFHDLVHLMTMAMSIHPKVMQTAVDNMLRATYNGTYEYRNVDQRFPWSIVDLRWDNQLKEIVEYLTMNNHLQNTSPVICAMIQESDAMNNQIYSYKDTIMKQICGLIELVTTPIR